VEGKTLYIEVSMGGPSNRGHIIHKSHFHTWVKEAQIKRIECYRSMYSFDESIKEHVAVAKTIRNYNGVFGLDKVVFDIDKGNYSDKNFMTKARTFIEKLQNLDVPENYIQAWFSGRGIHLTLPNVFGLKPSKNLPKILAETIKVNFAEVDNIYDYARLIRVGQTINEKSGLWKVPIGLDEIFRLDYEGICQLAKEPRKWSFDEPVSVKPVLEHLVSYPLDGVKEVNKQHDKLSPTRIVTCMQKAFNAGPKEGKRHATLLRLASWMYRQGLPKEIVKTSLRTWVGEKFEHKEVDGIVESQFVKGYSYKCEDTIMANFCDVNCIFYQHRNYGTEMATSSEIEKSFAEFIKQDMSKISFNLALFFPSIEEHNILPGQLVVLTGDTGVNKTALAQYLCVNLQHLSILYFSTEVDKHLMYRRFIQQAHGMTKTEVYQHYKDNANSLSQKINHIKLTDLSPKFEEIESYIRKERPHMVVVDTMEDIETEQQTVYDKTQFLASKLKQLAQKYKCIILAISHISKSAANTEFGKAPNDETVTKLWVHSMKGSTGIGQKADKVWGIEGNRKNNERVFKVLKARDESWFTTNLIIDIKTFRFKEKTDGTTNS